MLIFKPFKDVILGWIMISVIWIISPSLHAHVLTQTSAQVILRDGQIEVKVFTDIDHLISSFQNDQAWLMGDIDAVMPDNLSLTQQHEFIKNVLKHNMHLTVNDKVMNFDTVSFEGESKNPKNNTENEQEIVFQARHSFAKVTELSISFDKSLGAVHTSFVKPQYRLISPGHTAHIAL